MSYIQTPSKRRHFTTKVRLGGTTYYVGTFDTLVEALAAHREKFRELAYPPKVKEMSIAIKATEKLEE